MKTYNKSLIILLFTGLFSGHRWYLNSKEKDTMLAVSILTIGMSFLGEAGYLFLIILILWNLTDLYNLRKLVELSNNE